MLPGGTSPRIPESVRLFADRRTTGRSFRAARCHPLRRPGWPPLRYRALSPHIGRESSPWRQKKKLNLKHRDLRPTVEPHIQVEVANAGVHVKRTGRGVKQTKIILIYSERQHEGSIKRNPYLPTVRMTGQNQIEFLSGQFFDPGRVVNEEDVFHSGARLDLR